MQAAEGVTISKVHTTYKVTAVQQGKRYTIGMNDLFGDEERDIVLELHLPPLTSAQGIIHCCPITLHLNLGYRKLSCGCCQGQLLQFNNKSPW